MEGLTFSASHQGGSPELRNAVPAVSPSRPTTPSAGGASAQSQKSAEQARVASGGTRVEAHGSPFQARLSYDEARSAVVVEILDPATGHVVQQIPAETAADRLHELTGSHGGAVVDKIA